ncbi:MAG: 16S rRNA (adenine(1518)-N(6)/adenine(1519)-N(6))-dimethyltransferase RsmA [Desulfotomaculum sp.]|nr:16S rRNA (adenine(1518)-N(6)/adenine(1519)-N(6))-dimethyltransferase RsmA [Desulfotomaculum sp.]
MGELSSPTKVKEVLNRYHFHTKKSLGQNFLIDGNIINKIIQAADINKEDLVVEIGPGIGVLTSALADSARQVIAVEIDKQLAPVLKETLADYSNIDVIFADAMNVNFDQLVGDKTNGLFGDGANSFKLVANLPYYITTPIIMHMLTSKFNLHSLVIMVQKEVGLRMTALPGSKDYGALTVAVQYYTRPEIVFKVPRTVFYPRPEVDSVVVKLKVRSVPAVKVKDEEIFFKVVRAAFAKRRKTLLNALSGSDIEISKEQWADLLREVNIDNKRRGETLTIDEFALISNVLADYQY